jgi:hypothetical protein
LLAKPTSRNLNLGSVRFSMFNKEAGHRRGAFSTEFFPTYDFVPVRERLAREWREARGKQPSSAQAKAGTS